MRLLVTKDDPPATLKQKTKNKFEETASDKNTSMSSKLQNTRSDEKNIHSTPDILVSLPPLDYNIVDDMKKNQANIGLFELTNI